MYIYSCLENPHGQRNLAGYSPWGCKESDTTERLSTAQHGYAYIHTHTHVYKLRKWSGFLVNCNRN